MGGGLSPACRCFYVHGSLPGADAFGPPLRENSSPQADFWGLHWVDRANEEQKVLLDIPARDGSVESGAVLVHYDLCHPSRCSLHPPRHDNTVLILGWILTGVGILSTLGGGSSFSFSSANP